MIKEPRRGLPMTQPQAHIDAVLSVIAAGSPTTGVGRGEQLIQKSWLRCANNYGLDPALRPRIRVETSQRLRESRERADDYLVVAREGMKQLYRHVSDLGYVMLIADAQGVAIDYVGDGDLDASLRGAGLTLGANWGEAHAGTNGIGTCLAESQILTCHRDDHFYLGNIQLSCTATPLHGPDGDVLGVLDVSALSSPEQRESQHLVRRLTRLHGQMIEDALFMRRHRDSWILRLGEASPLVDVQSGPLIACDGEGAIVGADRAACRALKTLHGGAEIVGRALTDVLQFDGVDLKAILRPAGGSDRMMLRDRDGRMFQASVILPRTAPKSRPASLPPSEAHGRLKALGARDPAMAELTSRAALLIDRPINILIQGETGSGKEVFARALHAASRRAAKPFVAVNCASIPESLIESELFGYAPGTFTGARSQGRKGLVQKADGGTLFLDEIGDMPLVLQSRLLRVLSESEVLPLGADEPVPVALKVVSASHRDIRALVASGAFRQDLYYRLCGATLALPPLRDRVDLELLVRSLLAEETGKPAGEIELEARLLARLRAHPWPGNIRELVAVIRYAAAIADGAPLGEEHLPEEFAPTPEAPFDLDAPAQAADGSDERAVLLSALRRRRWNVTEAAKDLGCSRATLYRRMQRAGVTSPRDIDCAHTPHV